MSDAKRDANRVTSLLAVSNVDNSTPVNLWADPSTHELLVKITGSALTGTGNPIIDSYQHLVINLTAGANQLLVSSAANKQIWVYSVSLVCSVAGTISIQDEDDTAITGVMPFAANSGLVIPPSGNFSMPIWKLATNKDLEIDIGTADVDGFISYAIVSV